VAQEERHQSSEERQVEAMWPWMEMQWEEQMQELGLGSSGSKYAEVKLAGEKAAIVNQETFLFCECWISFL